MKCRICGKEMDGAHYARRSCGHHKDRTTCSGKVARIQLRFTCMKQRCTNPEHKNFERYKDTTICDEWLKDSFVFVMWALGHGWQDHLEIDRKDNSKGYSPENCRFVTRSENRRNQKNNVTNWNKKTRRCRICKITKPFSGFSVSRKEVGGISYECRLCRKELDRIKHIKKYKPKRRNNGWIVKGKYFTKQKEASIYYNVDISTISYWIKTGKGKPNEVEL